tara:strand:+ start:87 stop:587 length:501 start_codon:yes stop_codon:yes gene_type:complete
MKNVTRERAEDQHESPPTSQNVMVAQLSFEHQIALWSLRTYMKGPKGQRKVQDQIYKALSPDSAYQTFEAIGKMIDALQMHGKRSLWFNCLCQPSLTQDEIEIIKFFQVVQTDTLFEIRESSRLFVEHDGIDAIVHAALTMFSALEIRHTKSCKTPPTLALSTTVH